MDNFKNIKAIFFDLDNTLIPTRKADKLACNKLNEILRTEYGLNNDVATDVCNKYLKLFRQCPSPPEPEDSDPAPSDNNTDTNQLYTLDQWRLHLFITVLQKYHLQHFANEIYEKWLHLRYKYLQLNIETRKMLLNLKSSNYQLILISNGASHAQWEKINKINIKHLFNLIIVSGDYQYEKPSINIFNLVLKQLHLRSHECIMVGDKLETDILGGIHAKLAYTIWLPLQVTQVAQLELQQTNIIPDYIIHQITDLSNLLLFNKSHKYQRFNKNIDLDSMMDSNSNASDGS